MMDVVDEAGISHYCVLWYFRTSPPRRSLRGINSKYFGGVSRRLDGLSAFDLPRIGRSCIMQVLVT